MLYKVATRDRLRRSQIRARLEDSYNLSRVAQLSLSPWSFTGFLQFIEAIPIYHWNNLVEKNLKKLYMPQKNINMKFPHPDQTLNLNFILWLLSKSHTSSRFGLQPKHSIFHKFSISFELLGTSAKVTTNEMVAKYYSNSPSFNLFRSRILRM